MSRDKAKNIAGQSRLLQESSEGLRLPIPDLGMCRVVLTLSCRSFKARNQSMFTQPFSAAMLIDDPDWAAKGPDPIAVRIRGLTKHFGNGSSESRHCAGLIGTSITVR